MHLNVPMQACQVLIYVQSSQSLVCQLYCVDRIAIFLYQEIRNVKTRLIQRFFFFWILGQRITLLCEDFITSVFFIARVHCISNEGRVHYSLLTSLVPSDWDTWHNQGQQINCLKIINVLSNTEIIADRVNIHINC